MVFSWFRKCLLAAVLALVTVGGPAPATAMEAEVQAKLRPLLAELQRDGYARIETGWTWLGRLYVTAWRDGRRREIVIHPTSGEVLRDVLGPVPVTMAGGSGPSDGDATDPGAALPAASVATATSAIDGTDGAGEGEVLSTGVTPGTGPGPMPGGVALPNLPAIIDGTDPGSSVTGTTE